MQGRVSAHDRQSLVASSLSWKSATPRLDSVGDFFNLASGKVVVLSGHPPWPAMRSTCSMRSATSIRRCVNSTSRRIKVTFRRATTTLSWCRRRRILSGVPGPAPSRWLCVHDRLRRSGRPVYRASYDRPFGVLEIEQPQPGSTLYATYWQSPSAAAGLRTVAPGLLAAQTGDIFIFNRETAMYGDVDARPRPPIPRIPSAAP